MRVEVRVLADRARSLEERTIADPVPSDGTVPLRALIDHVVRAEVAAFDDRKLQRRFVRLLTADEVAAGAAAGKVDPGGRVVGGTASPDRAVDVALEAFEDGLYLVVVDGDQVTSLDTAVSVGPDTLVRFVRLTALAGG